MPITQSAKKALRQSQRRRKINRRVKEMVQKAIKSFRRQPNEQTLKEAYRQIDRAAKKKVFHKNKADRLKSRLAIFLNKAKEKLKKSKDQESKKEPKK